MTVNGKMNKKKYEKCKPEHGMKMTNIDMMKGQFKMLQKKTDLWWSKSL